MSLSDNIAKLRIKNGISQEQLAERLGVSRQAVQKWESGASSPDLNNLINIAKKFSISMDALLLDSDSRVVEELKYDKEFLPSYESMHPWDVYCKQLEIEYLQCLGEGRQVENYEKLFEQVRNLPDGAAKQRMAEGIFDLIMAAPIREDFGFTEPSDIDGIFALSKGNEKLTRPKKDDFALKVRGAWYGRIAGCLLGKPIEGIRTNELIPLLKETNNYPMHRYIKNSDLNEEIANKYNFRLLGMARPYPDTITLAPADDDTNYTVLGQVIIQKYGRDFTPADVASAWLARQPQNAYCTAERVAYNNFVNGYMPPVSAIYKNPYREYIGAQIRGDYFGYINPADPHTAAQMAWRDASISHVKNGIYGEMFVAAMLAGAATTDDFEKIIEIGLGEIPVTSRLYDSVSRVLGWYRSGVKKEQVFKNIHEEWDEYTNYGWCHTISNAMIVAAALLYGTDYGNCICLAVQTGFDTDCNGATVGSVYGMAKGIGAIPAEWIAPLNGRLTTTINWVGILNIDEAVEKTVDHAGY